ncbi:MAG: enoyl-ACP reductase [Alphaproteobacteria bacterium]|jgi:enoyl-[acyl-carrier protein] reductase I|nr:enoyl-ACP reductase [Alphaproteobacteria bacterium]
MEKLMQGKKVLIMGIANDKSMAWAIAEQLREQGADIACTYLPFTEKRVKPLAEKLGSEIVMPGDVQNDEEMDILFAEIEKKWGKLDAVLHAIGFSNKEELDNKFGFVNTTRENFKNTMDVSCFSYIDVCKRASKLMVDGGSCLTLTYYGGEKVVDNYNVMGVAKAALDMSTKYLAANLGLKGIRVNAISAGPIKTLAAMGISGFRLMLKLNELNAPLRRNIVLDDVAKAGMYMMSDLSSGVTGEIHHVDCGFNVMGGMTADTIEEQTAILKEAIEK